MAARQVIEVVQCRVADLKIGDVVRVRDRTAWEIVEGVNLVEGRAYEVLALLRDPDMSAAAKPDGSVWLGHYTGGSEREDGPPRQTRRYVVERSYDLVDLQLTRTVYNNAPHAIDVSLPGDEPVGVNASADAVLPWDDEDSAIEVTIYRSPIDGAAVVEIDTPFEPYGADDDPIGEPPGDNIRINLNNGKIWDNGLWDARKEEHVTD